MKYIFELILTVLASGITAAIVTHVLNARREEHLFIRQKLEDLHLALHRYATSMSSSFLPFLRAMEGGISYNQALDLLIKEAEGSDKDAYPTVERLIGIYFPDLESEMKVILASRHKLNQIKESFKQDYEKGTVSNGPWLEQYREELIQLEFLTEEMKRKIVTHPIKTTKRMPTICSRVPSTRCRVP